MPVGSKNTCWDKVGYIGRKVTTFSQKKPIVLMFFFQPLVDWGWEWSSGQKHQNNSCLSSNAKQTNDPRDKETAEPISSNFLPVTTCEVQHVRTAVCNVWKSLAIPITKGSQLFHGLCRFLGPLSSPFALPFFGVGTLVKDVSLPIGWSCSTLHTR